jgi:hypothetical protein
MVSFGYFKHKQTNLKFAQKHFGTKKLILIQWLDEEDWIKSTYIKYTTYNFSTAIGPHVCGSRNITKQNKIEKLCNAHLQNLLLFNMVVVFI